MDGRFSLMAAFFFDVVDGLADLEVDPAKLEKDPLESSLS
jgi:hypothetical protein